MRTCESRRPTDPTASPFPARWGPPPGTGSGEQACGDRGGGDPGRGERPRFAELPTVVLGGSARPPRRDRSGVTGRHDRPTTSGSTARAHPARPSDRIRLNGPTAPARPPDHIGQTVRPHQAQPPGHIRLNRPTASGSTARAHPARRPGRHCPDAPNAPAHRRPAHEVRILSAMPWCSLLAAPARGAYLRPTSSPENHLSWHHVPAAARPDGQLSGSPRTRPAVTPRPPHRRRGTRQEVSRPAAHAAPGAGPPGGGPARGRGGAGPPGMPPAAPRTPRRRPPNAGAWCRSGCVTCCRSSYSWR